MSDWTKEVDWVPMYSWYCWLCKQHLEPSLDEAEAEKALEDHLQAEHPDRIDVDPS